MGNCRITFYSNVFNSESRNFLVTVSFDSVKAEGWYVLRCTDKKLARTPNSVLHSAPIEKSK